jgi:hypothetical protein
MKSSATKNRAFGTVVAGAAKAKKGKKQKRK